MTNHNPFKKTKINSLDLVVATNLRKYRLLNDVSLGNIAELLNISLQQVQKYELGTNRISASKLYYISKFLETNLYCFFEDKTPEPDREDEKLLVAFSKIKDRSAKIFLLRVLEALRQMR